MRLLRKRNYFSTDKATTMGQKCRRSNPECKPINDDALRESGN